MEKFEEVAKEFNFVLVRPEGVDKSWNAKYCCGYALEQKLDDVMFFNRIIDDLDESFDFVNKDMTYGVGWSNGAFMVTYAAHLFRSVAPIAGYQYVDIVQLNGGTPRGLFQHHSLNDDTVLYKGCSNSTTEKCCCGIPEETGDQDTSVDQAFDIWASDVNRCTSHTTTSYIDKRGGIECRSRVGCSSNTTLCVHKNSGHFNTNLNGSFTIGFPMFEEVGDFFARDACFLNAGQWESGNKKCTCANGDDDQSSLFYCSGLTTTTKHNPDRSAIESSPDSLGLFTCNKFEVARALFTLIGIVFIVRKYLKGRVSMVQWKGKMGENDEQLG